MKFLWRCLVGSVLLIFLGFIFYHISKYGIQWHFVNGTPDLILAADGVTYPDGEPVDPIELALYRSGYAPHFYWLCYAGLLYLLSPGLRSLWRFLRSLLRR